jgi:hypothetical protein
MDDGWGEENVEDGEVLHLDELEVPIETDDEYAVEHLEINPLNDLIVRLYLLAVIYGVFIFFYTTIYCVNKKYGPLSCLTVK